MCPLSLYISLFPQRSITMQTSRKPSPIFFVLYRKIAYLCTTGTTINKYGQNVQFIHKKRTHNKSLTRVYINPTYRN